MQLGRYTVSTLKPPPIHSISFSEDGKFFSVAGEQGYEIWKSWPLALVKRKILPGTLSLALLLPNSPLLVLQGGGANPLYSPNKLIIYNDKLGLAVAEIEFGERINGIKARRGLICVALSRKVITFQYEGFWLKKLGEWETAENELGLMALSISPGSSLLALPGRQAGHVQLITLPPCPPIPISSTSPASMAFRSPIILAHTHSLSTLSCNSNGSHIITSSERGTLLRIWDTSKGRLERELRRGVDKAEMWGCDFENDNKDGKSKIVAWSDKGTIHVWKDDNTDNSTTSRPSTPTPTTQSLTNMLSRNLPLPKYFSSSPSIAQYHLPRKNPHAISSALGKAGVNVPTMKNEYVDENDDSEMFVVSWIDVEVPFDKSSTTMNKDEMIKVTKKNQSGIYDSSSIPGSIGMGMREERRSFGSDNTSRTVTPTPNSSHPTFTGTPGRLNRKSSNSSNSTTMTSASRSVSSNFVNKSSIQDQPNPTTRINSINNTSNKPSSTSTSSQKKVEKQLIVITYSGDWYRLRIPHRSKDEKNNFVYTEGEGKDEEESRKLSNKCELVEYRRLGVGGSGW
ncbi:uncharacterized protein L201_007849 [Kwoniella dendrophila CBS 6074]|uniref:WD40 repeat-like protein n=1 Tax=Kwoniella dendrophila CBS 6074 TaxID=1295534 RepID=A0AAX4K5P4_9TREE